jgi:vesicle-associated membrane protein 7
MTVIYCLIARPPDNVLIDSTNPAHTGNFSDVCKKILANIPAAQQADGQKVTFVFEGHTFNFRAEKGLMFMCMCEEAYGRTKPFAFLKDIIDTYFLMFSGQYCKRLCIRWTN